MKRNIGGHAFTILLKLPSESKCGDGKWTNINSYIKYFCSFDFSFGKLYLLAWTFEYINRLYWEYIYFSTIPMISFVDLVRSQSVSHYYIPNFFFLVSLTPAFDNFSFVWNESFSSLTSLSMYKRKCSVIMNIACTEQQPWLAYSQFSFRSWSLQNSDLFFLLFALSHRVHASVWVCVQPPRKSIV